MRSPAIARLLLILAWPSLAGCQDASPTAHPPVTLVVQQTASAADRPAAGQTYVVEPGDDVQYRLQARLIEAVPGGVIQLEAGTYRLARQLDVATDNLTIRGRGPDQTVLTFKGQPGGTQGLEATGDNFVLEDLAVEDTAGNAVKILGARNVTLRRVRAEWTGEPSPANGAYGLYPVQCENVLMEECIAIGASDSGLYVGQCRNVVVRACRAERNVAGIEIENTVDADVYDNVTINNTGGVLVFDLPGLQLKAGKNVRIFRNRIVDNNHRNFADPGGIVASVPPGTGLMVMATDHVEAFDNTIENNGTGSVLLVSYLVADRKISDPEYDPISEHISIHDNRIAGGGTRPQGAISKLLQAALGARLPDILWDGVTPPGTTEPPMRLANNGDATFANFNLPLLSFKNLVSGAYRCERDASLLQADLASLPAVELRPHDPPSSAASAAALVYRSLPRKLSEFGFFTGELRLQQPAPDVLPYELNAALFSDYADKRRFIKLPEGAAIGYRASGPLEFPVGTVIAKTFSYPHDMTDRAQGERLLETRIELLREDGWYGATYIWNDQQTDAELALGGGEVEVQWIHADGEQRSLNYQFPNANQCLNCHSDNKAYVPIGPTARNLHRPPLHAEDANQLADWAEAGALDGLPALDQVAALPYLHDPHAGTAGDRARAWLDVNCAHCHSPGGTARTTGLDLRYDQQDPAKLGVWKSPVAAGHGSGGRRYDVTPGRPDESILLYRLESDDPSIAMPSVGRRLVPVEAVEMVRAWIAAMPADQP
jgi:parallel beta-helix repeat protein